MTDSGTDSKNIKPEALNGNLAMKLILKNSELS